MAINGSNLFPGTLPPIKPPPSFELPKPPVFPPPPPPVAGPYTGQTRDLDTYHYLSVLQNADQDRNGALTQKELQAHQMKLQREIFALENSPNANDFTRFRAEQLKRDFDAATIMNNHYERFNRIDGIRIGVDLGIDQSDINRVAEKDGNGLDVTIFGDVFGHPRKMA